MPCDLGGAGKEPGRLSGAGKGEEEANRGRSETVRLPSPGCGFHPSTHPQHLLLRNQKTAVLLSTHCLLL